MSVQHSDEAGGGSSDHSTMPDRGEKKQKAHGSSVWQSFKKAGGEVSERTVDEVMLNVLRCQLTY